MWLQIPGMWEGEWADGKRKEQKKHPGTGAAAETAGNGNGNGNSGGGAEAETAGDDRNGNGGGVFYMALKDFCRHLNRVVRFFLFFL